MVKVMISNVAVHNNPAKFLSNYTFEIKFECLEQLTQGNTHFDGFLWNEDNRDWDFVELEFKLVYVGDAKEDKQDQVLDVVVIDAVAPGTYKFVFEVGDHWLQMIINKFPSSFFVKGTTTWSKKASKW